MPSGKEKFLTSVLTPLSWIYGGVTALRNFMFNHGMLPQEEFKVPIVSVGNLTVGGTGKTHIPSISSGCFRWIITQQC